jgi:DNA-binding transcriptional LysR family regulator
MITRRHRDHSCSTYGVYDSRRSIGNRLSRWHSVGRLRNSEAIKELVKLGLGVGILAPWIAQSEIEEGSLVAIPLGRRKLRRHWGIVHWQSRRLSLLEETFAGLCKSVSDNLPLNL